MKTFVSSKTILAALVISAGAYACSSSPSTTGGGDSGASSGSGSGSGGSSSGSGSGGSSETFTDIYTTILQPTCSTHHAAGAPDSFLDLSSKASAYAALVGTTASGPACGATALDGGTPEVRVVAGHPSESLLFQKVSQMNPPCGAQMPFHGTPLAQADQTKIQSWIIQGAANN
jgi:hypothetical protein